MPRVSPWLAWPLGTAAVVSFLACEVVAGAPARITLLVSGAALVLLSGLVATLTVPGFRALEPFQGGEEFMLLQVRPNPPGDVAFITFIPTRLTLWGGGFHRTRYSRQSRGWSVLRSSCLCSTRWLVLTSLAAGAAAAAAVPASAHTGARLAHPRRGRVVRDPLRSQHCQACHGARGLRPRRRRARRRVPVDRIPAPFRRRRSERRRAAACGRRHRRRCRRAAGCARSSPRTCGHDDRACVCALLRSRALVRGRARRRG